MNDGAVVGGSRTQYENQLIDEVPGWDLLLEELNGVARLLLLDGKAA